MKATNFLGLWVAVGLFSGCGSSSEAQIYSMAIDATPILKLPASCYQAGKAPTTTPNTYDNFVSSAFWRIWPGIDETLYLELGSFGGIKLQLGHSPGIDMNLDTVEGTKSDGDGPTVFKAQQVVNEAELVVTNTATFSFDELKETTTGELKLAASCSGTGCDAPSCEVTMPFVGRQVEAESQVIYPLP